MERLPTSLLTRIGYGFLLGATLKVTLSPLFGPCLIVLVNVEPTFLPFTIPPLRDFADLERERDFEAIIFFLSVWKTSY